MEHLLQGAPAPDDLARISFHFTSFQDLRVRLYAAAAKLFFFAPSVSERAKRNWAAAVKHTSYSFYMREELAPRNFFMAQGGRKKGFVLVKEFKLSRN